VSAAPDNPLPTGFTLDLDPRTELVGDEWLVGGVPTRALRLSATGRSAWDEVRSGDPATHAARSLSRRLVDAGAAEPIPARASATLDVTVVIPVYERAAALDRCLAGLAGYAVVVVDDGSPQQGAEIEAVCARHRATYIRREDNGGAGVARDTGLRTVTTEFVAFVDSDCVPAPGWIEQLAPHFDDPIVAAVAPRIVADAAPGTVGAYAVTNSALDLGRRASRVAPGGRVGYVPTAALVLRRCALGDVSRDGNAFDARLRTGEDVDLVWRLDEAGWRVRYEPAVAVRHTEPSTWRGTFARRARYGMSSAPLITRHPDSPRPLTLRTWSATAVAGALLGSPLVAVTGCVAEVAGLRRMLRRAGLPTGMALTAGRSALTQTWSGVARYATQFASPVVVAGIARRGRGAHGVARRAAWLALLLSPPIARWLACRRTTSTSARETLPLIPFVFAHVADDVAYGAGVWAGCVQERSLAAVTPAGPWSRKDG
jgi:mycofactocin system glycosyltransferase